MKRIGLQRVYVEFFRSVVRRYGRKAVAEILGHTVQSVDYLKRLDAQGREVCAEHLDKIAIELGMDSSTLLKRLAIVAMALELGEELPEKISEPAGPGRPERP